METSQFCNDATQELVRGVQEGDLRAVKEALENDVNLKVLAPHNDGVNRTLLGLAAFLGHAHLVVPLVAAGVDVNGRGSRYFTPLHHAAREKNYEALKELVNNGADINATTETKEVRNSVLHTSTMGGDERSVALLLEQPGLNISPQDDLGYTPLHVASRINHIPILNRLVEKKADLHLRTIHGWTPLHIASMSGSLNAIKRLLELKLDIFAEDREGRTPCDLADELGMTEVYWYFIKKAGQPEKTLLTAPQKSEDRYDIEKWLLDWAADGGDRVLPMLVKNQPDPFDGYYQNKEGYTTLHIAAEKGHHKAVKALLEECLVYPVVVDRWNRTPADLARENGHFDLADFIESYIPYPKDHQEAEDLYLELLELIGQGDDVRKASSLLLKGAPIEPIGQHSTRALNLAITANRRRILTMLLAAGAPITNIFQGLNILQISWISPNVSTYIRMIVTRAIAYVLEAELSMVDSEEHELRSGINVLLEKIRSPTPWLARWPDIPLDVDMDRPQSSNRMDENQFFIDSSDYLTHVMTKAVRFNCSMTTAFLQQAGGIAFAVDAVTGDSPFTVAMKYRHWNIARQIAKGTCCLYIPNGDGILPCTILPEEYRMEFENEIFDRESRKIDDEREKAKDDETIAELSRIQELHKILFDVYIDRSENNENVRTTYELGAQALLLASQLGLSQLVNLLLEIGGLDINCNIETIMGTTALHQAAAFGHSDLCTMLIKRGALIRQKDNYNHTPPHFAAMFGHEAAFKQLSNYLEKPDPCNFSNNSPNCVRKHFYSLLSHYNVLDDFLQQCDDFFTSNNPAEAQKKKLDSMSLSYVVQQSRQLLVDFHEGEAAEVKAVVIEELEKLKEKIAVLDPTYTGTLELLGSAADNTRLHAPDEFDFNFCVDMAENLQVEVERPDRNEALLKGHSLDLKVESESLETKSLLRGSNWKDGFYKAVVECLKEHRFSDRRLSLVPPGVTRTQVGVGISLSWQGEKYPLLLIGIDLVPVLKAFWPEEVERPYLTPEGLSHVFISNIGDGQWRLSFANLEAGVLKSLHPEELRVYLTCKTLLSCLKAEPWMPKAIKNKFTWWNSRRWKIPIPSGFALKNCFLRRLEEKKQNKVILEEKNLACHMLSIFKLMVEEEFYEVTGITGLVSRKIYAYFGGDFEKPKLGEGSLEILRYLEKSCHH